MRTNKSRPFIFFIFLLFFVNISISQNLYNSVLNIKSSSFEINSSHKSFENLTFDTGEIFIVLREIDKNDQLDKNIIHVYPNPFIDELNIISVLVIESIEVYSIDGKLIYEKYLPEKRIDLNRLKTGVYLLNVNKKTTFKIIKL